MLLADKLNIEQKLKVNMLSIELRELDFYRVNCNTIGTQAALLCGFAFTGIVEAPWDYLLSVDSLDQDSIPTVSNGGYSTGSGVAPGFGLKFATVLFFLLGMLAQLMCVVKAMQISILAPGLAIRGPEGSMGKALQAMRLELKRLRWQFQIGVLFYFIGTDLFIWSIFDWVTALVATIILVSALVWIVIDSIKIAERLRLPQAANLWTHAVDRHAAADQACFSCTGAYVTNESESVPHVHVQFDPHAKAAAGEASLMQQAFSRIGTQQVHGASRKKQLGEDLDSIGAVVFGIEPFVPADAFAGPRAGYIFRRGERGVGYYADSEPHSVAHGCAAGDAHAMRSSVDSLIFHRDIDGSVGAADPRDFSSSAGARSETLALSEGVDFDGRRAHLGFEDIPHASFSAPGKRLGAASSHAFQGAAGATTTQHDAAFARQQAGSKVKLRSARSDGAAAERLIFGSKSDAGDGSPGRGDAYEVAAQSALYSNRCGIRSGAAQASSNVIDVSTRPTTKLTDASVYGVGQLVTGSAAGSSLPATDPRDLGGRAGARSQQMGERRASTFDITKMPGEYGGSDYTPAYAGAIGMPSAADHPHGVRPIPAIQSYVSSAKYDKNPWAGKQSDKLAVGQPGQRKYEPGLREDFVSLRPISDISDFVYESEKKMPSAGGY